MVEVENEEQEEDEKGETEPHYLITASQSSGVSTRGQPATCAKIIDGNAVV